MNSKEPNNLSIGGESKINKHRQTVDIKIKKMHLDAGWFGKIFGNAENAPTNICGIVALLLIITGTIIIFFESKVDALDYWKTIIVPILSVMLGYLFGKGHK